MPISGTMSVHDDGSLRRDPLPCLVRVLRCTAPLEPSMRVVLPASLAIGRGELGVSGGVLRVPDDRMSATHARITRDGRRVVLADLESKNGTLVNGTRVSERELADGDVLEIGHTFFVYRSDSDADAAPFALAADKLPMQTFVPALAKHYEALARVAPSLVPVVVLGETGTGKEVVARAVHHLSGRDGPFVALNCGAIAANLIESELFGVKKGAFSGASEDRPGLVRAADGGTLFLDEIGELPASAQVALLRVLQEREVLPVGGTRPVPVDVRIVAATHRALDRLVDDDAFRSDLYARLGGLHMTLLPLRERREDLGLIVTALIRKLATGPVQLSRQAAAALFAYPFPRNIRELETTLGLAITMATARDGTCTIELEHLPETVRNPPAPPPPADGDDDDESRRARLVALMTEHKGRIADVARAMGKARMQIHRWLQRYGLDADAFRK